ncbi:mRNA-decapping enzyme 1B [Acanthochromis polyacanthus]|uniref:5'-(N(7)-methylguanosine 5'-triphospho)-[mRNA] hydrolase n=1 Tax=Acanthochromis polyacanthus TaxID=80966 RepID=A0A3Q1EV46_9TELE|nr:mRNA-decapping enzyme 1B [Acanthochromis polyacanthus]
MTATSSGSTSCLAAKGLDISLAALKRQDPYINNIVDVASQVALYTYNNRTNEWEKTEVEGTLFVYTRLASPRHGFTIMNRLSMENLTEPITKDLDFQLQDPFLLYRNARLVIHGIWFYDKEDCQRIAQRMRILTQQEQVLAQSQGGWLSPAGGGGAVVVGVGGLPRGGESNAKAVDIIQMLSKARTEYDKEKSTSEPKEIGGSSVLSGNPHLIKPIPVKPNAQDSEGAELKPLSLATLFGPQHQHHHSSKPDPVPNVAAHTISAGKVTRPPVARTLTYGDAVNSSRGVTSNGGNVAPTGSSEGVVRAVVGEDGGHVVGGLLSSPTTTHQQQHCPAIAKLMQGQRGVGGVLQTVSESPENRLCDNGVPLDHHHHHLYHQQYQQHHHQLQQLQSDPIKRLFQGQPPPPPPTASFPSTAPPCCSNPPPLQQSPRLSSQPVIMDSVSCSHLQAQQSQQLYFSLSKSQAEVQHSSQTAAQGTGLPSQMPGVVSPHELLQKLQLVQQEQSLASNDPPRPCPNLAPRFLGPTQSQGAGQTLGTVPNTTTTTAGQKAALQFQVISPQRIPATVAPSLLLSPSVFIQTTSSGELVAQDNSPATSSLPRPPLQKEVRVLSRNQLQATLLHLIQTDGSFLDSIYEAYISRFANDSSGKY